jgi:hypothetical protein
MECRGVWKFMVSGGGGAFDRSEKEHTRGCRLGRGIWKQSIEVVSPHRRLLRGEVTKNPVKALSDSTSMNKT